MTAPMVLYHASPIQFASGSTLRAGVREQGAERAEFERRFAEHAPNGAGDRRAAVFAADDVAFAARYLEAEAKGGDARHVYEVHALPLSRHPMVLVNVAFQASHPRAFATLAAEYWCPTREWRIWEYLCAEAVVVAELAWPDLIARSVAQGSYFADYEAAKRLSFASGQNGE